MTDTARKRSPADSAEASEGPSRKRSQASVLRRPAGRIAGAGTAAPAASSDPEEQVPAEPSGRDTKRAAGAAAAPKKAAGAAAAPKKAAGAAAAPKRAAGGSSGPKRAAGGSSIPKTTSDVSSVPRKKTGASSAPNNTSGPSSAPENAAAAAADAAGTAAARPADGGAETAVAALLASLTEEGWREALRDEFSKPYFAEIANFVQEERRSHTVHPPAQCVFEALNRTPFKSVRAVIVGQDPYHEPGQAHGLCFSVRRGVAAPPSLKNIYKELEADVPGFAAPGHGDLSRWCDSGVLLLNATLTVREGHQQANSHAKCGWLSFTDAVILALNRRSEGVVFLLWGAFAQKKGQQVDCSRHRIVAAAHPSPLSVTKWRGSRVFSRCNAALRELGREEIDWSLPSAADELVQGGGGS